MRDLDSSALLRHMKNAEPAMEYWQSFGDVGSTTEVDGALLNAGSLNRDTRRLLDGLVLAVSLLAKKCTAMEREMARVSAEARGPVTPES